MKFGVFYQLPCGVEQTPQLRYQDTIAQALLADELGFDQVWLAELHFNPSFSVMPAPLLLASAIAQVTERIKIGTAVNLVPLHQPVRLAEEVATLDLLSEGRAIFGIGRGSQPRQYGGYGIDIEEGRARFLEALQLIIHAWTREEACFSGEFYQVQDVNVVPKPAQQPHPPVYIAANSADTFGLVGELGHNILVAPLVVSREGALAGLEDYRSALARSGHDTESKRVNINLPVYVTEDPNKIKSGFELTINNYLGTLRQNRSGPASRAARRDYEEVHSDFAAIGTPEQVVAKLKFFQKLFNPQEFMCWFNTGGMLPHREVAQSMELFAQKVMPHFRQEAA